MQYEFVRYVADGVRPTRAAELAGYSAAAVSASKLMRHPDVAAALRHETHAKIRGRIIPLAAKRHLKLLQDKDTPPSVLVRAIELAYKAGAVLREPGDAGEDRNKQPSARSREELEAMITRLESALSAYDAKTIDTPKGSTQETVIEDDPLGLSTG